MVYVPFEVVERLMLTRFPKPTALDIRIEWFKMLEWLPTNEQAFEEFRRRFPLEDRKQIRCRPYTY